ncbi:MAG: RNA-processing protein [Methanomicrobiales archaeon]|nr:RNA-processing protein [Methanomicrobiales archaeon]
MLRYWFERLDDSPEDISTRNEKERGNWPPVEGFTPLDWRTTVDRGLFGTRQEYLSFLRTLCLAWGERRLSSALQEGDERILRMVQTLDEISGMIDHLTGRLVDWYGTVDPTFTRKDQGVQERALLARMKGGGDEIFLSCVEEGEHLLSLRNALSREVSLQAEASYPNCSALVGGLVAARLIARAGGLERLARMSSATIQVLGAENALFSHLHTGSSPPKHGIIYQHGRVHAAPRNLRGRVARVLAGRVALAARLDYYRETLDREFVKGSQERINRAGKRT